MAEVEERVPTGDELKPGEHIADWSGVSFLGDLGARVRHGWRSMKDLTDARPKSLGQRAAEEGGDEDFRVVSRTAPDEEGDFPAFAGDRQPDEGEEEPEKKAAEPEGGEGEGEAKPAPGPTLAEVQRENAMLTARLREMESAPRGTRAQSLLKDEDVPAFDETKEDANQYRKRLADFVNRRSMAHDRALEAADRQSAAQAREQRWRDSAESLQQRAQRELTPEAQAVLGNARSPYATERELANGSKMPVPNPLLESIHDELIDRPDEMMGVLKVLGGDRETMDRFLRIPPNPHLAAALGVADHPLELLRRAASEEGLAMFEGWKQAADRGRPLNPAQMLKSVLRFDQEGEGKDPKVAKTTMRREAASNVRPDERLGGGRDVRGGRQRKEGAYENYDEYFERALDDTDRVRTSWFDRNREDSAPGVADARR